MTSDTRRASYEASLEDLPETKAKILHCLIVHGPCTVDEITKHTSMDLRRVRPTVTRLSQDDQIRDTGNRRKALWSDRQMAVWEFRHVAPQSPAPTPSPARRRREEGDQIGLFDPDLL